MAYALRPPGRPGILGSVTHGRPLSVRLVASLLAAALLSCVLTFTGAALAAPPPADPLVAQQGHLPQVRAFEAWDVNQGGDVVVAVLDTGADLTHPDLMERLVEGIDLVEPGTPPEDPQGHGTLVAGIIAAVPGNARGVTGVAPQARVMPIRVLDDQGRGTSDVVAEGIRYAASHGARVINLSLTEVPGPQALALGILRDDEVEREIEAAVAAGIVVVGAAGNAGGEEVPYAEDSPVIVVGAVDGADQRWPESNADPRTLFAPGVEILSTWHQARYAKADGTSFATPIVAAGVAMLLAAGQDPLTTRDHLARTAVQIGVGLGRVDLAAALTTVAPPPGATGATGATGPAAPPPPPAPTPPPPPPQGPTPPTPTSPDVIATVTPDLGVKPATPPPTTPPAIATMPEEPVPLVDPAGAVVVSEPAVTPTGSTGPTAPTGPSGPSGSTGGTGPTGPGLAVTSADARGPMALASALILADLLGLAWFRRRRDRVTS